MSVVTADHRAELGGVTRRCATLALQISFLLGRQAILRQEPPIHFRSTTAVRRPDRAICQAIFLPPSPLPRSKTSTRSG